MSRYNEEANMTNIRYEWTAELVDEHGDIVDSEFADTYAEIRRIANSMNEPGCTIRIGLMRDRYAKDDSAQLVCRSYSYIGEELDNKLSWFFTDASGCDVAKVPAKFHCDVTGYALRVGA